LRYGVIVALVTPVIGLGGGASLDRDRQRGGAAGGAAVGALPS